MNLRSISGLKKYLYPREINIYTDGSKMDGKTGAGYVVYKGREEVYSDSFRLHDTNTVFQAEIAAIRAAADWVCEEHTMQPV